jgi:hypothetical protein
MGMGNMGSPYGANQGAFAGPGGYPDDIASGYTTPGVPGQLGMGMAYNGTGVRAPTELTRLGHYSACLV